MRRVGGVTSTRDATHDNEQYSLIHERQSHDRQFHGALMRSDKYKVVYKLVGMECQQQETIKPVLRIMHDDITSTDMYRPITLTPVISKLFESVLLQLYGDFLTSDNLQFGFKKETGCCHALFTLTESVKHFVNNGSKVHCTFLDASKAFDKVLLNRQLPAKLP